MTGTRTSRIAGGAFVAIAAGLAAALLFVLAARGSVLTLALGYFAPLPIMVAAISYGLTIGGAAALIGAAFIAIAFHPALGLLFALAIGAPAALIASAAILAPPADEGHGRDRAATYAILASTIIAFVTVAALIGVMTWRLGGFDALLARAIVEATPVVKQLFEISGGAVDSAALTRRLVLSAPVGLVASQSLIFLLNLWVSGRVAIISGNLPRPWPSIADDLVIPWIFGALLAVAFGLIVMGGLVGAVASAAAAALGLAFTLQGLAVMHVITRGLPVRIALLIALYTLVIVLPPWPFDLLAPPLSICLLAIVGLVDAAFHLRTRKSASLPKNV